jgi:hypothetical protein
MFLLVLLNNTCEGAGMDLHQLPQVPEGARLCNHPAPGYLNSLGAMRQEKRWQGRKTFS